MEIETWRLLDLEYDDPYMNLAVEEAIARKVGEGVSPNTVRFWRNKNAVIIGRFQSAALEANLEACKTNGTTIIRRFTGGGAVYHDQGNLNYGLSLHKSHPSIHDDISINFKNFLMGVIKGLRVLGLNAQFKPIDKIQVNGRKISGAAGCLRGDMFFLHGSLLVSSNLDVLSKVLNIQQYNLSSSYVPSVRDTVTTVQNELRTNVSIEEVRVALKTGFEKSYGIRLIEGKLMEEEGALAELYHKKYSSNEWTFEK